MDGCERAPDEDTLIEQLGELVDLSIRLDEGFMKRINVAKSALSADDFAAWNKWSLAVAKVRGSLTKTGGKVRP
jgi:hypothetical protein